MDDIPSKVDDYTIGKELGRGISGTTFGATTVGPDRRTKQVVVKFLHPARATAASWMPRLTQDHGAWLARYMEVGRKTKRWSAYHVSDRFNTIDPVELLSRATIEQRLELVAKVADAIAALHAQSPAQVHGWLKPSNVLVRYERDKLLPIVTDAGVRLVYDPEFHDAPANARETYPYLAPEAVEAFRRGGDDAEAALTPAADVYALGVYLCSALAGTVPGLSEWETTADEILAGKRRPCFISALTDPKAPVDLAKVNATLAAALAEDPAARPTAEAFGQALRAAVLTPEPQA